MTQAHTTTATNGLAGNTMGLRLPEKLICVILVGVLVCLFLGVL